MVITLELHSWGGRGLLPDTEKQKPESAAVFTSGAQCSQQPLDDGKGCWWQLTFHLLVGSSRGRGLQFDLPENGFLISGKATVIGGTFG